MFSRVKSGIEKVKNFPYKKAAVYGAIGALALSGGNYAVKQYKQLDAIEQFMNSDQKIADDMVKNGLAEKVIKEVKPKGYVFFDEKVEEFHSSSMTAEELKKKTDAAKALGYKEETKYVLLDTPESK